jgi:cytochrome b561
MPPTLDGAAPVSDTTGARYTRVAMALHWAIAALIGVLLALGWWMNEWAPDHSPLQDQIQWWHVSFGLTLLILVAARIVWRATHAPPRLVSGMAPWERSLASFVHVLLYLLLLAQPLLAWALMTSRGEHLSLWGIPIPALPGIPVHNRAVSNPLKHLHIYWMIWAYLVVLFLHVAGALKHQFDGHPVLWRMVPFLRRPSSEGALR